jgi:murein L,D-transpeptidase YcbB/YkuD
VDCPNWDTKCRALAVKSIGDLKPLKISCDRGVAIFAKPNSSNYYQESSDEYCVITSSAIELKATRFDDAAWLQKEGKILIDGGKYGEAAVVYSALNVTDPSAEASENALVALGLKLGVPKDSALGIDNAQGKKVASPELVKAVKDFQKENYIWADGVAGAETLKKLVGDKDVLQTLVKGGVY